MALVTLAITPAPIISAWESPAAEYVNTGIWPTSKVVYNLVGTVLAKDAADESRVTMTMALPQNFYYRQSMFFLTARGTALSSFVPTTGFEIYMGGDVQVVGSSQFRFTVGNNSLGNAIQEGAYKALDDASGNDFQATYSPLEPIGDFLIDASAATANLILIWLDTSDDATTAVVIQGRLEFMQYTIEQALAAPINTPTLIY